MLPIARSEVRVDVLKLHNATFLNNMAPSRSRQLLTSDRSKLAKADLPVQALPSFSHTRQLR